MTLLILVPAVIALFSKRTVQSGILAYIILLSVWTLVVYICREEKD
jgi:hypothetical protein